MDMAASINPESLARNPNMLPSKDDSIPFPKLLLYSF